MTVVIWIVVILIYFCLYVSSAEKNRLRKEQEQLEEAAKKTRNNLIRYATPQIIAYGVPDSQKAPPPEDQPAPKPGPDDELIDLEKGKWSLVNAGCSLASLMLTPGSVNVGFQPAGSVTLEVKKTSLESPIGFLRQPEPFTLKDFRVVRPGPETAILSYTAVSGHQSANATTVWTRRGGRWVTSSYQMVKG